MRITGGTARGIPLVLPARGEIRPATDYLREAVFSSLGALVVGARVLDCFAGTGAYAWESLSRGAVSATLADKNPSALAAQKKNFAALKKSLEARGESVPAVRFVSTDLLDARPFPPEFGAEQGGFTLVFCDPPWEFWKKPELAGTVENFAALAAAESVAGTKKFSAAARLILETPAEFEPHVPAGWTLLKRLGKKGKSQPNASVFAPLPAAG